MFLYFVLLFAILKYFGWGGASINLNVIKTNLFKEDFKQLKRVADQYERFSWPQP